MCYLHFPSFPCFIFIIYFSSFYLYLPVFLRGDSCFSFHFFLFFFGLISRSFSSSFSFYFPNLIGGFFLHFSCFLVTFFVLFFFSFSLSFLFLVFSSLSLPLFMFHLHFFPSVFHLPSFSSSFSPIHVRIFVGWERGMGGGGGGGREGVLHFTEGAEALSY